MHCTSGLIILTSLHLVHIARLVSFLTDLHLIGVARLPSFSSLAYILYTLLVLPNSSHWISSCTYCSFCLILPTEFHLVYIAHLPSFFSMAYHSYWLLIYYHSPLQPHSPRSPTCCNTHCSPALMCHCSYSVLRDEIWDIGLCIIMYI